MQYLMKNSMISTFTIDKSHTEAITHLLPIFINIFVEKGTKHKNIIMIHALQLIRLANISHGSVGWSVARSVGRLVCWSVS